MGRVAYECEAGHFYYFDEEKEDHGSACRCEWIDRTDGSPREAVECDAPARRAGIDR